MNKETSDRVSSIAARLMRTPLTFYPSDIAANLNFQNLLDEAKTLAGSVLSQDEHKGPRSGKATVAGIHPAPVEFSAGQLAIDPILQFFHYAHLPPVLQAASGPFCTLAKLIVETLPRNAERTVALRKLLEAKDAAVRANLPTPGVGQAQTRVIEPPLGEPREVGGHDEDREPLDFNR